MASRCSRNRRDKRAEAEEVLGLADPDHEPEQTEFTTPTGERIDLRAPLAIPTRNETRTTEP